MHRQLSAPRIDSALNRTQNRNWRIEAQLFAVVLMWGLNFVVIKLVLTVMHPFVMNVFRILAAGTILGLMYFVEQRRKGEFFFGPLKKYPFEILRLGLVGWAVYQTAFVIGLNNTTAGSAAIIMASVPLWTALFALTMRIEKLNRVVWLGLVFSIVGTAVVVLTGEEDIALSSEFMFGNMVVVSAAMLWGGYTALTKTMVDRVSPLGLTVLALIVSLPVFVVVSIPYLGSTEWSEVTLLIWVALLFSGSLSTGIAVAFWNNAIKVMGASHTAAFNNVVPIVALVSSFFLLGEPILFGQILGGSMTIGGLIIMRRGRATAEN